MPLHALTFVTYQTYRSAAITALFIQPYHDLAKRSENEAAALRQLAATPHEAPYAYLQPLRSRTSWCCVRVLLGLIDIHCVPEADKGIETV